MKDDFVVLVVEDDSMARNVIVEILRDDGFSTEEAEGFQATLQIFTPGKYQVAVLDNQLGDGTGTELCRRILTLDPEVKVFLFAGSTDDVRLEALEAGVTEVLQKPYDLTKLPFLIKRISRTCRETPHFHENSSSS